MEVHKREVSQAPGRGAQRTATDSPFSHRSDPACVIRPPPSSNWSRDVTLPRERPESFTGIGQLEKCHNLCHSTAVTSPDSRLTAMKTDKRETWSGHTGRNRSKDEILSSPKALTAWRVSSWSVPGLSENSQDTHRASHRHPFFPHCQQPKQV